MMKRLLRARGAVTIVASSVLVVASWAMVAPSGAVLGFPPGVPGLANGFTASVITPSLGGSASALASDGHGHLLVGVDGTIVRMNMDGTYRSTIATGLGAPGAVVSTIAVDPDGNIWAALYQSNHIWKMGPTGANKHVVATPGNGAQGLTFDGYGHAYVTLSGSGQVVRMNLDGTGETVIASGLAFPWGIHYDHAGHLYVADKNHDRLLRMSLSGTNQTPIDASGLSGCESFSILPDGNLLIADYDGGAIYESAPDGTGLVTLATGVDSPEDMVVDPLTGSIYYASWDSATVGKVILSPYATSGINSATVTWRASAAGTTPTTSYTVTATPANGGVALEQTVPGTQTSATFFGLVPGDYYRFSVYGTNSFGNSDSSALSNPVTVGPRYPDAPSAPSAARLGGAAKVSWSAPTSSNGSAIIGYFVTTYPAGSPLAVLRASVPASASSTIVTGLTNGTAYQFTVTAINSVGLSNESARSPAVVPAGPPSWSSAPTATALSKAAKVSWSMANANGAAITGYKVISSPGSKTCTSSLALTCTVKGLSPGVTYTFRVIATNHLGSSAPSAPSNKVVARA